MVHNTWMASGSADAVAVSQSSAYSIAMFGEESILFIFGMN